MHFGHPRTITDFKNWNLLKITVFQSFSYHRSGHFGLIFGVRSSKLQQKMQKKWWKNENKIRIVWKMFQTLQEYTLGILWPLQSSKKQISSKFGFFRGFLTPDHTILGQKISKFLQKMTKERWKNKEKLKFSKNSLNTSRMHLEPSQLSKTEMSSKLFFS